MTQEKSTGPTTWNNIYAVLNYVQVVLLCKHFYTLTARDLGGGGAQTWELNEGKVTAQRKQGIHQI